MMVPCSNFEDSTTNFGQRFLSNAFVAEQQEEENKPIEETLEMGEEDLVSALPDPLLIHILSLLSSCALYARDSIKTCVLSKRWQYLWTSVPILILEERESSKHEFVSSVNKILILRGHKKLKKFEITTFNYDDTYQPHFDVWIRYAVVCNVEGLEINTFQYDEFGLYKLPMHIFRNSSFTKLYLANCVLEPIGKINWNNLKSLCIGCEFITQKLINNILSGSPSLECLELSDCVGSGFDVLNIASTSLRKLVVFGYSGNKEDTQAIVKVLKIRAHNILSLEIRGNMDMVKDVFWLDVPSLVEAYLDFIVGVSFGNEIIRADKTEEELLKRLIKSLQHVKELKCGPLCLTVLSRLKAKGFACPPNMKSHVTSYIARGHTS